MSATYSKLLTYPVAINKMIYFMCAIWALIRPQVPPTSSTRPMRLLRDVPTPGAASGTQTPGVATPWLPEIPQTGSQWLPSTLRGDSGGDRPGNV